MEVSKITRSDVDHCGFLLKMVKDATYECKGDAVGSMHGAMGWLQSVAQGIAESWNKDRLPPPGAKVPEKKGVPKNVKVSNPKGI